MCRSIKVLRRPDASVSEQEIQEAALQFVRKISGYRTPSQKNAEAFDAAVREVTGSSERLLQSLAGGRQQQSQRRDRQEEPRPRSRRSLGGRVSA